MSRKKIAELRAVAPSGVAINIKVYRDSEWQEYRARIYHDGVLNAAADVFDTERDSILATAAGMLLFAAGRQS